MNPAQRVPQGWIEPDTAHHRSYSEDGKLYCDECWETYIKDCLTPFWHHADFADGNDPADFADGNDHPADSWNALKVARVFIEVDSARRCLCFECAEELFAADKQRKLQRAITPSHPLWSEFVERLDEALDLLEENGKVRTNCTGSQYVALRVLTDLGLSGIEIEATLFFCQEYGGHCDCEIMMNVASRDAQDEGTS
jgi:hypothetical protein